MRETRYAWAWPTKTWALRGSEGRVHPVDEGDPGFFVIPQPDDGPLPQGAEPSDQAIQLLEKLISTCELPRGQRAIGPVRTRVASTK